MADKIWTDWKDLKEKTSGRKIFFYGCSQDWAPKALRKIGKKIEGFIDNSDYLSESIFLDLPVKVIEGWKLNLSNEFFVITSGQYEEIAKDLLIRGYSPGIDFVCSPDFRDYVEIEKFLGRQDIILFSSPDYPSKYRARGSETGGGLFLLNSLSGKVERVFSGSIRQFEIVGDFIFAVDHVDGTLCKLDHNFDLVKKLAFGSAGWCGLAFSEEKRTIFVSNPTSDEICEISIDKLDIVATRKMCGGMDVVGGYHLNDLEYMPDALVASCFSLRGDKTREANDGGVSAIGSAEIGRLYLSGLSKPHSPRFINGKLWVLESGRGKLLSVDADSEIHVGGFVRGLDFSADSVAVGQSRCMYLTDRLDNQELVDVDCGVRLVNLRAKLSRFFPIPSVTNVHDLRFWLN